MSEHKDGVRVHIDEERYESPNPTTADALYALGKVRGELELYREVGGDEEDPAVPRGPEIVHLQEDEHFHSGRREVTIVVNGEKKSVNRRKLSFAEIVALAFNPVPTKPNLLITITYRNGPRRNREGTLMEGASVKVKEGMIFNVRETYRS